MPTAPEAEIPDTEATPEQRQDIYAKRCAQRHLI
jgi:hypothetical protein